MSSWGPRVNLTQLSSITTEQYSEAIELEPREVALVHVKVDFPSSPNDTARINAYTSPDDGTAEWSTVSYIDEITLANSPDPGIVSFTISGVPKFRIGVKREDGGSDTLDSADIYYQKDATNSAI